MSSNTSIQWTDVTDNIFQVKGGGWWCRKISPGCANCYAAKLNQNTFFGGNQKPYTGDAPEMILDMDTINGWSRMKKPKKHFVCSMTDVFGDWVTQEQAIAFLRGMWRAPNQIFQVLTKRPANAGRLIAHWLNHDMLSRLPDNIWIGTSVENQDTANKRIPELLAIPAKIRFLSVEPMLEKIDLYFAAFNGCDSAPAMLKGIHWAIFGGESGPKSRPCDVQWIRSGVEQCRRFGMTPFVKQLGQYPVIEIDDPIPFPPQTVIKEYGGKLSPYFNDKKGGDMSEWPEDLRVREFPSLP